jgi:alkanesulfonate monooxygenase SsuD/methylene tetrahydromethanopterin reductase-like flavin-dependent oxidoreductase (luciferase family)
MTSLPQAGLFDHLDRQDRSLTRTYEERLQLIEAADRAGFRAYHLAEHHFTPLGMAPSPSVFLAAVAQRTVDLRIGSLVHVLPLYHPVRLAEEICMLDHLSGGRVEFGVGAGTSPHELRLMGADPETAREQFREAFEVLLLALRNDRLTYQGRRYRFDNVELPMRPVQRPNPPAWYPCTNPERLPWIAAAGFHTVVAGPDVLAAAMARTFLEVVGQVPAGQRVNAAGEQPLAGLLRTVFVGRTDAEARITAGRAFAEHARSFATLWARYGGATGTLTEDIDVAIRAGEAIVGAPATVRERVAVALAVTGCNYFVMPLTFGNLPAREAARSLQAFVEEVAPGVISLGEGDDSTD